ncbi:MAG: hypothetical protein WCS01_13240 [bacterium]
MYSLFVVAIVILVINLPFGFWREGVRKFSLPWFLAIHLPVPLAVGVRVLSGVRWSLSVLPVLIGAFAAGQYLGGFLRRRVRQKGGRSV